MKCKKWEVFVSCFAFALAAEAVTPTIITQPQSIMVNNASAATFTVVATNAATYQWQFQSNNIPGATNATLNLDDVSTNEAGFYTVEVSNAEGNTNSAPAQLTITNGTIVQVTISGYAGGGSNTVHLQLFDHDKPATVQNFLHYVIAGAFTNNMIWDRCVPGFVLQGGGYDAANRTNGYPPAITPMQYLYPPPGFPSELDNEFSVGPLIHNRFGTVAMAKQSSGPDTATSAFFFNLADNSTNLDNQNGGFTVFGRILDGSNVLRYFNTNFSKPFNGIFDNADGVFTDVPVNYRGTDATPGDSNFFYGDFTILSQASALETNPPTLVLVYPTNGATVTNADVVIQGTASDAVSLARVVVNLSYNGSPFGADAIGTTNWSLDLGNLAPGTYSYGAGQPIVAQNGAGYLSTPPTGSFLVPQFPFYALTNGPGTLSTNLNPTNVSVGSQYVIVAKPLKGCLFVCWSNAWGATLNPSNSFTMTNGMEMTAVFVSNTLSGDLAFTSPVSKAKLTNSAVTLKGTIKSTVGEATITCQIFSQSGSNAVTGQIVTTGSNTWSMAPQDLAAGTYIAQAVAQDTRGRSTVISEEFTVEAPLSVTIVGSGTTSPANGAFELVGSSVKITASAKQGNSFFAWLGSTFLVTSPSLLLQMSDGAAVTAVFVSNSLPAGSLSVTSPASGGTVLTNIFNLTGKLSAALAGGQITCQLFTNGTAATIAQLATISGATWTLPMSGLPQGAYTLIVIATGPTGRTTLATQKFTVNYFQNIAGTYDGLLIGTNSGGTNAITATNSGYISITLKPSGVFSGGISLPYLTSPVSISGVSFPASGSVVLGANNAPLSLGLAVDLTNGTDQMTGYLRLQGYWSSSLLAYRTVTKLSTNTVPATGKYVLSLSPENPTNAPTADSYATVSMTSAGGVTVIGALADNATFSQSPGVSKDGVWPLYSSLYSGKGILIGWQTNTTSNTCAGQLTWIKPTVKGTYYTNGFTETLNTAGAKYEPPMTNSQYQIVFQSGTLTNSLTNLLTVNKSGQFVPLTGAADTDKLSISLSSAGVLTGSISNTVDKKTLDFKGAFISPFEGGSGFILDTDGQTGSFQIGLGPL